IAAAAASAGSRTLARERLGGGGAAGAGGSSAARRLEGLMARLGCPSIATHAATPDYTAFTGSSGRGGRAAFSARNKRVHGGKHSAPFAHGAVITNSSDSLYRKYAREPHRERAPGALFGHLLRCRAVEAAWDVDEKTRLDPRRRRRLRRRFFRISRLLRAKGRRPDVHDGQGRQGTDRRPRHRGWHGVRPGHGPDPEA